MTDDDKALVERLFAMADEYDSGHHESWPTIDALEIAAHRIEALSAENERLREAFAKCVAVQIFPDGKGGHKVSASFADYKAANPLFILLTSYISDERQTLGETK